MTREETKELLPIIQAFAEGKAMQDWTNDTWKDKEYMSFGELSQSPIKPQLLHECKENDSKTCSCHMNQYEHYSNYITKHWNKE